MSEISPLSVLFTDTYLHMAEIVMKDLDNESFLASRLVCKDWRVIVNNHKPKWKKINQTCIIDAARAGHLNMVELLLAKGANVNTEMPHIRDTALHKASRLGYAQIVEVLLANGAQVNKVNNISETALHMASLMGRTSAVRVLLSHGANVNGAWTIGIDYPHGQNPFNTVNPVFAHARSGQMFLPTRAPLVMASMQGHLGVVKVLLEHGADVRIQENSALHYATGNRHREVAEALKAHMNANEGAQSDACSENRPCQYVALSIVPFMAHVLPIKMKM